MTRTVARAPAVRGSAAGRPDASRRVEQDPLGEAVLRAVLGAGLAVALSRLTAIRSAPALHRTNHRGATVSLASGPAAAVAAVAASGLPLPAAAVAGLLSGAVGAYDDAAGARPDQLRAKGFRGHLAALRRGQVTAGTVKIVGVGIAGLGAAALLPATRRTDVLLDGALVAGSANLLNLLDLRPGRALKVALLAAVALRRPGLVAVAGGLLPDDLAERTMLGDAGANALGAVLGLALADRLRTRPATSAAVAALVALTAASEVVSFGRVIDATPPLRRLDRLGRRP